ncbi:NADH-quinone oxidoreductase subunit J [Biformimicrobium ophioploci]|uniref:NADH-quinone oxidoreductase subunit J n=1 Tax=Biformimicrobium ophioploci TaxID=3036711 RepID=A0ABQ6LX72_9GAMM|nr:NADH-quinone oxidoreductase subunit J [Microbulbifer sp. NKW57]GMG86680.1 NADH-quinone oxidoreductase subunit J [Microbulbifer sp. NKW57]
MELFYFYLAGTVAILATAMVITRLNAVHALLYLIVSLLAVACLFFQLGAPFAAALEVIVYAGAIMVLMVFVIMMLNQGDAAVQQESAWLNPKLWAGPGILCGILLLQLALVVLLGGGGSSEGFAPKAVPTKEVGIALFGPYLIAVELASMVLLAGLVGAFHLARPATRKHTDSATGKERNNG